MLKRKKKKPCVYYILKQELPTYLSHARKKNFFMINGLIGTWHLDKY